jgi:acetyl esterase
MRRKLAIGGVIAVLACAAWVLTPWPSLVLYRTVMDAWGVADNVLASKHAPADIEEQRDLAYLPNERSARLDVYRPARHSNPLPVVVWVHGGGFMSGDKAHVANYLKIIAGAGFATVAVNYGLAPMARYPEPVRDVADALRYLQEHAARLRIDTSRIVLAGDSAGAQIAAQVGIVVSSRPYAASMQMLAPIPREHLRGLVLFCGLYDPDLRDNAESHKRFLAMATKAYFGVEDISNDPRKAQFSIVGNLPAGMPPLFVSAGNGDPLVAHAYKLVEVARAKGVQVEPLFFESASPKLDHEYQFVLDSREGQEALQRMLGFLRRTLLPTRATAMN